jgi:hypothetical protein
MLAKTLCAMLLVAGFACAQDPAPARRTILENRVTQGKAKDNAPERALAPQRTIDSLLDSTEDLNSIRDGYLRRLAGDGCRPDVAARVAELRARLNENGSGQSGVRKTAESVETNSELSDSMLILAASWYQPHADSAPARANPEHERAQLLELVLSAKDSQAASSAGADAAQAKAELDRLLATCRGAAVK